MRHRAFRAVHPAVPLMTFYSLCPISEGNGGPTPLVTPLPTAIINVPAGANVTTEWHHGGSGADPTDAADPIDPSHKGN